MSQLNESITSVCVAVLTLRRHFTASDCIHAVLLHCPFSQNETYLYPAFLATLTQL